ncbi:hypothetical protein K438DRAFT_2016570 [Mycena galopus ATCC 62051]|nr:hypothetical protein K438DRAFT_2016570 [Mycena galopus ATCC 62051]
MSPIRPTAPRTRAAQPYKPIGTLVDQLNRIIGQHATPRFDVNATMAYDKAAVALGFTLEELEAMATAANPGIIGVSCIKCDLPVALWGFGLYIFDTDDNTLIVIDYICKACWKYSLSNPRFDWEEDTEIAPPCTCPAGSMACQDVPTGCELHTGKYLLLNTSFFCRAMDLINMNPVPAMMPSPLGRKRIHRPKTRTEVRDDIDALIKRRQQAWDELWERHDQAVGAGESFNANKHDLSGIKRRLDEAVDLRQQLRNTRVANFRMPPRSPKRTQLVSQAELRAILIDPWIKEVWGCVSWQSLPLLSLGAE